MGIVGSIVVFIVIFVSSFNVLAQESTATRGRRISNASAAEATVTLHEQFLNSFLAAIFDNLQEPSMPLTFGGSSTQRPSAQCASDIRLKCEGQGVRTPVHFETVR